MSIVEEVVDVAPFTIEADHPRNSDLLIQGLENCRLRSAIKPTKEVFVREGGVQELQPAAADMVKGIPGNIPGMQLHINPEKLEWIMSDPLDGNERMLEQIKKAIDTHSGYSVAKELKAVPLRRGSLDKHQMKTLCRELLNIVNEKQARIVKGPKPTMEDVENLPGDFLLMSSTRNKWRQPRFEKDHERWADELDKTVSSG